MDTLHYYHRHRRGASEWTGGYGPGQVRSSLQTFSLKYCTCFMMVTVFFSASGLVLGGVTYDRLRNETALSAASTAFKLGPSFYLALVAFFVSTAVLYALQQARWCELFEQQSMSLSVTRIPTASDLESSALTFKSGPQVASPA